MSTIIPDVMVLFTSLLGWFLAKHEKILLTSHFLLKYSGLVLISVLSLMDYSLPSLIYTIIIIYWVIISGLFLYSPDYALVSKSISVLSLTQLFLTFTDLSEVYGRIEKDEIAYFLLIAINVVFSAMAREDIQRINAKNIKDLAVPLNNSDEVKKTSTLKKALILLFYFIGKFCLYYCLTNNQGITGLLMLVWLGFTLLEPNLYKSMRAIKFLLMPVIVFSYTVSYLNSLWYQVRLAYHPLLLATIIIFSNCYSLSKEVKNIKYTLPLTWYGKIASIIISNSYLFSLTVLFMIGLSEINLLHTGLMILCILYMSKVSYVKEYWRWLIIYIMFFISIRYIWKLLKIYLDFNENSISDLIGLDTPSNFFHTESSYYENLIWILLLISSLQQFANNYDMGNILRLYENSVFNFMDKAYNYFSNIEFWLIYCVIMITISFSDSNLLNFIRFIIFLIIISKHLESPHHKLSQNYSKLNTYLQVLKVYSGILLASRYIFQFQKHLNLDEKKTYPFLGLEHYESGDLYTKTASDTILLVTSVLLTRSNTNWIIRHNDENSNESTEKPKTKGSVAGSVFYNFFSKPFQYLILLAISSLSIFWKLSISMLIYLIIFGIYQISIAGMFTRLSNQKFIFPKEIKLSEWTKRSYLWNSLFYTTVVFLAFSYFRFLAEKLVPNESDLKTVIENSMFLAGFTISPDTLSLLKYNNQQGGVVFYDWYGYLIMLVTVIIERHCIQFMIPKSYQTKENGWDRKKKHKEESQKKEDENDFSAVNETESFGGKNYNLLASTIDFKKKKIDVDRNRAASVIDSAQKTKILKEFKEFEDYESTLKKLKFVSAMNLVKVICEALISMCVLILAFYKITIVSFIYVVFMFIVSFFGKLNKVAILNVILILLIVGQYGVLISNISDIISPYDTPKSLTSWNIPWYDVENVSKLRFYSLGTEKVQLTSIFYETLIQTFILFYYFYLSLQEKQLERLKGMIEKYRIKKNEDEQITALSFKAKLKQFLFQTKILFYKFARFSIVIIVLLFMTQSKGVLSALYCLFCLSFINRENSILHSHKSEEETPKEQSEIVVKESQSLSQSMIERKKSLIEKKKGQESLIKIQKYSALLGHFLRLIIFDLTLQIFFQFPFEANTQWLEQPAYFGLIKLTEPGAFYHVMFKVFTFTFLLMVQAMMNSPDFKENHIKQCSIISEQSQKVGKKMSYEFNRKRIYLSKLFKNSKKIFNKRIEKLKARIALWNKRFDGNYEGDKFNKSEALNIENLDSVQLSDLQTPKNIGKQPFKFDSKKTANLENISNKNLMINSVVKTQDANVKLENKKLKFIDYMIDAINPALFRDFIRKITVISSVLPDRKKTISRCEEMKKLSKQFYESNENYEDSESSLETDSDQEIEVKKEKGKKKKSKTKILDLEREYDFHLKDYPQFFIYLLASNTQTLVYLAFIANHFMYASLESFIFPLSIFAYSMLEYPRPKNQFFRIMLIYAQIVFFIKFIVQLKIWEKVVPVCDFGNRSNFFCMLSKFNRDYKIGFSNAENTYSGELLWYVFWDVLLMFTLLFREYYVLRIGMWDKVETDYESLEEAKYRLSKKKNDPNQLEKVPKNPQGFFDRLLPINKEEKPGQDLYLFTFLSQLVILIYLFFFFNKMDGDSQSITVSIQSNQFQGRMVVSVLVMVMLIVLDRYVYLKHTSKAIQDAANDAKEEEIIHRNTQGVSLMNPLDIENTLRENRSASVEISTLMSRPDASLMETYEKKETEVKNDRLNERNTLLIIKLILHGALLIIVHVMIFWYFPINGNIKLQNRWYCEPLSDTENCNNFEVNTHLQIFYILYLIYLILASQQIRFGLPSFTKVSFPLMRHVSSTSNTAFKVYRGAPFLFELRTLIDWTFTKTSLNIFQWFKFEDIHAQLYLNQCNQKSLDYKKPGESISKTEKCQYGVLGLLAVLLIILLPLFLFSTLNPITENNLVSNVSLSIKLIINNRAYKIYSAITAESIRSIYDPNDHVSDNKEEWETYGFKNSSNFRASDRDLMQIVEIPLSADSLWLITPAIRNNLLSDTKNTSNFSPNKYYISLDLQFYRKFPQAFPISVSSQKIWLTEDDVSGLYSMIFNKSGGNITTVRDFKTIYRLPSSGTSITPIIVDENVHNKSLVLKITSYKDNDWEGEYWNFGVDNGLTGKDQALSNLKLFTISDNYSPITFNFSILTFYISIVYVAGRLIRLSTNGTGMNTIMTDMKNPDHLCTLCSGVYVSRMIGQLLQEEQLYYELLDILRSPEIIKALTGKSSITKDKIE